MTTKEWLDEVSKGALCSRTTLQATYDAACAVIRNGVPGDFLECGVWAGANSAAMARAICDAGEVKFTKVRPGGLVVEKPRVHLFDSFEGIPQAGPHDKEYLEAGHAAGLSASSLENTKKFMRRWGIPEELLVYHPGWFADTVASMMQTPIALLRLDGDLYESTKVCIEHLYPLVSAGGIVIIDDWALSGCRKAVMEAGLPAGPCYFFKE